MENDKFKKEIYINNSKTIKIDIMKIAKAAINLYGKKYEKTIMDVINNTYILPTNEENGMNMYEILKKFEANYNFAKIINEGMLSEDELKMASGVAARLKILDEDGNLIFDENGKMLTVSVIGFKTTSTEVDNENYKNDEEYVESVAIITHEVAHSIMRGMGKLNMISENIIEETNGFMRDKYEVLVQEGKTCLRRISECGIGLEEGFIENDTIDMLYFMGIEYNSKSYKYQRIFNEKFENKVGIRSILKARRENDSTEIEEKIGQETLEIVKNLTDMSVNMKYEASKKIYKVDDLKKIKQRELGYLIMAVDVIDMNMENQKGNTKNDEIINKVEDIQSDEIEQICVSVC